MAGAISNIAGPDDARDALRHALGRFSAALTARPLLDLHAVIIEAPEDDHPRLRPGAGLPPLPINLRDKRWSDAFSIPLVPAAKVLYFGDEGLLGPFRDLSRDALAALRVAFPDVAELVARVPCTGPRGDADRIPADLPLLIMRNIVGHSPSRRFEMERWHWTGDAGFARVPYYEDERRAVGLDGATPPEAGDAPNVTTFTNDVFSFAAVALDFAIVLMREADAPIPP